MLLLTWFHFETNSERYERFLSTEPEFFGKLASHQLAAESLVPRIPGPAVNSFRRLDNDLILGERIRQRRMELRLRPSQIERMSNYFSLRLQDPRCVISHSTLAGIEAGAIPSFHKILTLAYCLRVTDEQILEWYGIDLAAVRPILRQRAAGQEQASGMARAVPNHLHFPFRWPSEPAPPRTGLFEAKAKGLPAAQQQRFRYARVGSQDDSMDDILPPGCIVRIDTHQRHVVTFPWQTMWHRPIYLVWHAYGHTCCWCQQNGPDLSLIYHPASNYPIRRMRVPKQANIIGRAVSVWTQEDMSMEFPGVESSRMPTRFEHL